MQKLTELKIEAPFQPGEWNYTNPIVTMIYSNPLLYEKPGKKGFLRNRPPYGYMVDPDSPVYISPDPKTADIVRYIFHQIAAGYPCNTIAKHLTKEKVITPAQRRKELGYDIKHPADYWNAVAISNIVTNSMYIGDTVFQLPGIPKILREQALLEAPVPPGSVIHGHHEPIVSFDLFESANIVLQCNNRLYAKTTTPADATAMDEDSFSFWQLYCSECGRKMSLSRNGTRRTKKPIGYICASQKQRFKHPCKHPLHDKETIRRKVETIVLKEIRLAKSCQQALQSGFDSEVYLYHARPIQTQIQTILDHSLESREFAKKRHARSQIYSLVEKKTEITTALCTPNVWVELFASLPQDPKDFTLTRELTKQLIQEIRLSPDGSVAVTFRRLAEKNALLSYFTAMPDNGGIALFTDPDQTPDGEMIPETNEPSIVKS